MKSGIIFQACDRNAMPDPDTLVLGMNENNDAAIGCIWYDEASELFFCSSIHEHLIVTKWAHIAEFQLPELSPNGNNQGFLEYLAKYYKSHPNTARCAFVVVKDTDGKMKLTSVIPLTKL